MIKLDNIINHNISNYHLALANKQQNNPNAKNNGTSLDNAISSYKQSLRNNPHDNETRYNLIAAEKMEMIKRREKKNRTKQNQDQQQQQQQQQRGFKARCSKNSRSLMQEDERKLQEKKKVNSSGRSSDKAGKIRHPTNLNLISMFEVLRFIFTKI